MLVGGRSHWWEVGGGSERLGHAVGGQRQLWEVGDGCRRLGAAVGKGGRGFWVLVYSLFEYLSLGIVVREGARRVRGWMCPDFHWTL